MRTGYKIKEQDKLHFVTVSVRRSLEATPNGVKIMLHRGTKLLVILFSIASLASCSRYKEYDAKEIQKIRERSMDYSLSILGHDEYWDIYNKINDSINVWKANDLKYYKYFGVSKDYMVDSILCVNKSGNKLITSILLKQLLKDGVQDDIWYFYGVKIKGNWCFFDGPTMVLLREAYQKDIHQPLSFEKLKQIATFNIYRHYLKKNEQSEWEINERFFSDLTSVAWCGDCVTQEQWDAAYMRQIYENWSRKK
jgi:hypothetical protein